MYAPSMLGILSIILYKNLFLRVKTFNETNKHKLCYGQYVWAYDPNQITIWKPINEFKSYCWGTSNSSPLLLNFFIDIK